MTPGAILWCNILSKKRNCLFDPVRRLGNPGYGAGGIPAWRTHSKIYKGHGFCNTGTLPLHLPAAHKIRSLSTLFGRPLKNPSLDLSEAGSEKCFFHFPSFSVAYSD